MFVLPELCYPTKLRLILRTLLTVGALTLLDKKFERIPFEPSLLIFLIILYSNVSFHLIAPRNPRNKGHVDSENKMPRNPLTFAINKKCNFF